MLNIENLKTITAGKTSKYLAVILLLAALQLPFTLRIVPVHLLPAQTPFLYLDHAVHCYKTLLAKDFIKQSGRSWGYDPNFMAGYPTATVTYCDNNAAAFAQIALSRFTGLPLAVKIFILVSALLLPVLVFFSGVNFGLNIGQSLLSALLLVTALNYCQYYKSFMLWGMYSFVLGSGFALLNFSLIFRYFEKREKAVLFAYAAAMALAMTVHPLSFVIVCVLAAAYAAFNAGSIVKREALHILAATAGALAVNAYWIAPLLQYREFYVPKHFYVQVGDLAESLRFEFVSLEQLPRNLIIAAGLVSPVFLKRAGPLRNLAVPLFAVCLFFLFIAFVPLTPLRDFEPVRFLVAACFIVPPLAAAAAAVFLKDRVWALNILLSLALLFAIAAERDILFYKDAERAMQSFKRGYGAPLELDILRQGRGLIDLVKGNTDNTARVLIEDNPRLGSVYWQSHFLAVLPRETGRQFIGGPYNAVKLKHAYAGFAAGEFLGLPLKEYSIEGFMRQANNYNIKWVFAHSAKSLAFFTGHKEYFTRLGNAPVQNRAAGGSLFSVKMEPSYFLEGSGEIEAGLDRIRITQASKGRLVIKYHYLKAFRTEPPMPLKEYTLPGSPVGFIELDNTSGAEDILIYHR